MYPTYDIEQYSDPVNYSEPTERELNPPEIKPTQTFEYLTSDEQEELLDDAFGSEELGDVMADMQDNESLHDVILMVHKAWRERCGLNGDDFSFIESMSEILIAWDKSLRKTLTKKIDNKG